MGLLSISCKKATYLVSKKEEGKLSWIEKIQLRSHLAICSLCRLFEKQTAFIIRHLKQLNPDATLSTPQKERMEQKMTEEE